MKKSGGLYPSLFTCSVLFSFMRYTVKCMKRNLQFLSILLLAFGAAAVYWQLLLGTPVENEVSDTKAVEDSSVDIESSDQSPDKESDVSVVEDLTDIGLYTVSQVVDGDTVRIWDGSELLVVRVLGIDAPETERSPDGAECFNEEATAHAEGLLAGKTVSLITDSSQDTFDAYGRLLAYVELSDGSDFGREMIYGGYAEEFTFKGVAYARQVDYQAAEAVAKQGEVGLWGCEENRN